MKAGKKETKPKTVSYGKYGYLFIAPFFIVYLVFSLWPLINTFYYSMFEYTTRNLRTTITFTGLQNYLNVLGIADGEQGYFLKYLGNTLRLWLLNFVPQILLSLLAAAWLTNNRAKLKARGFYKVVLYMPNIITAASISLLFCALLSKYGPIMSTTAQSGLDLTKCGYYDEQVGNRHIHFHDPGLDVVWQYYVTFDCRYHRYQP